jgi:hypothetical protein
MADDEARRSAAIREYQRTLVQHKEVETQSKKSARATQPSILVCAARSPARPTNRAGGMRGGAVEGKGGMGVASTVCIGARLCQK